MTATKYDQARNHAARVLEQDLLPVFLYHNAAHTLNEVVPVCAQLAELEGAAWEDCQLLGVAACFHDLGFTAARDSGPQGAAVRTTHEELSAQMARAALPGLDFSAQEIERICRLILATSWAHQPQDLLEEIIRDADMSSIGGSLAYYRATSDALRAEMAHFGITVSDERWLERQLEVLSGHTFYTRAARELFDENRLANIGDNQRRLNALRTGPKDY